MTYASRFSRLAWAEIELVGVCRKIDKATAPRAAEKCRAALRSIRGALRNADAHLRAEELRKTRRSFFDRLNAQQAKVMP